MGTALDTLQKVFRLSTPPFCGGEWVAPDCWRNAEVRSYDVFFSWIKYHILSASSPGTCINLNQWTTHPNGNRISRNKLVCNFGGTQSLPFVVRRRIRHTWLLAVGTMWWHAHTKRYLFSFLSFSFSLFFAWKHRQIHWVYSSSISVFDIWFGSALVSYCQSIQFEQPFRARTQSGRAARGAEIVRRDLTKFQIALLWQQVVQKWGINVPQKLSHIIVIVHVVHGLLCILRASPQRPSLHGIHSRSL